MYHRCRTTRCPLICTRGVWASPALCTGYTSACHSLTVSDLEGYESDGEYDDLPERVACVCVCVCACVRVCARARARVCVCVCVCNKTRTSYLGKPAQPLTIQHPLKNSALFLHEIFGEYEYEVNYS